MLGTLFPKSAMHHRVLSNHGGYYSGECKDTPSSIHKGGISKKIWAPCWYINAIQNSMSQFNDLWWRIWRVSNPDAHALPGDSQQRNVNSHPRHNFNGGLTKPLMELWASYQIRKIAGCACAGNAGNVFPRRRFQRKPIVSDPGMHHGTCVTHVPWCMSGSLTCGDGETFPAFPAHAHPQFYVSGKRPMASTNNYNPHKTINFSIIGRGPWSGIVNAGRQLNVDEVPTLPDIS